MTKKCIIKAKLLLLTIKFLCVMKEQYLNPDLMYKFICKVCHANGYMVLHFNFLRMFSKDRPGYLSSSNVYNYCYEAVIFRPKKNFIPEHIPLKKEEYRKDIYKPSWMNSGEPNEILKIDEPALYNCLEFKALYFDILCERFFLMEAGFDGRSHWVFSRPEYRNIYFVPELDGRSVEWKKDFWPPYIAHDGIYYYAIYNSPRVQKEQFLRKDFHKYQEYEDFLYPDQYLDEFTPDFTQEDTAEQIMSKLQKKFEAAMASKYDGSIPSSKKKDRIRTLSEHSCKKNCFIHHHEDTSELYHYPLFYTSNALELTLPISEAVLKLEKRVSSLEIREAQLRWMLEVALARISYNQAQLTMNIAMLDGRRASGMVNISMDYNEARAERDNAYSHIHLDGAITAVQEIRRRLQSLMPKMFVPFEQSILSKLVNRYEFSSKFLNLEVVGEFNQLTDLAL